MARENREDPTPNPWDKEVERENGRSENILEVLMSQDCDKNNKKTKKGGDQKSKKVRIVFCYKSQKCFKEKV